MKYTIFTLLFVSITLCQCATQKAVVKSSYPSPFEFTLIDTLPGTKDELYVKAYEWVAKTFNSAKAVIQMQDKEAGKIIGKGIIETANTAKDGLGMSIGNDNVHFTFTLDIKDGRYRCVLSDFIHEGGSGYSVMAGKHMSSYSYGSLDRTKAFQPKRFEQIKSLSQRHAKSLLVSLKDAMRRKPESF